MAEVIDNKSNASICRVFRFKFNKEIIDMLTYFAKLHQYDKRADYKEAWKAWYEENNDTLQREANRIIGLGYSGNVEDKMYKAARYYFRNKALMGSNENTEKSIIESNTDQKKRDYITLSIILLDLMDEHIKSNINKSDFTPAKAYCNFCNTFSEEIKREIQVLIAEYVHITNNDICKKIKKAYKNRYYQYITHN